MRSDLFRAAESGHVPTIQNLYDQDSDVLDQVTFQGDSALHIAARKSHLHLVTWILDRQPSLAQLQNKDKNRPLHEAAKSGNRELVETLLPHKQRYVYDCNEFGETALTIASKYGHVETVRLLLQTKSNEPGFETKSPFDRDLEKIEWELSVKQAAYRGYRDIVVAMLGHPVKPMKLSLADKVACAKEKLINIIDDRSDHIRAKYWHTQIPFQSILKTPFLHTAVQGGHLVVVEAILNHDLWSNDYMTEKDEYGRCAVHVAAMKGHWDIINQFISKRADCVDIRSSDHKSVLHFAVIYNQVDDVQHLLRERDPETVRELLSSDHSCFGNTALHLAAIYGVNRQVCLP